MKKISHEVRQQRIPKEDHFPDNTDIRTDWTTTFTQIYSDITNKQFYKYLWTIKDKLYSWGKVIAGIFVEQVWFHLVFEDTISIRSESLLT